MSSQDHDSVSDDHSYSSDGSEVSNFASTKQTFVVSPRSRSNQASHPSPALLHSLSSSKDSRPSPRGSACSLTSALSANPSADNTQSKFRLGNTSHNSGICSPEELCSNLSPHAVGSPSQAARYSPYSKQDALRQSETDRNIQQLSCVGAAKLNDYIDDPLMKLRTNREHSDLVIRERDDEPHLRFMSLHFTAATPHAIEAFRSNWSEERDALLQDDEFMHNKRAAFLWMFSDKQCLQSPGVKAYILRPSEIREITSNDPDVCNIQVLSDTVANGSGLSAVSPSDVTLASRYSNNPVHVSESASSDGSSDTSCHAVIHNIDTGATAMCTMHVDVDTLAAEGLVDLPAASHLISSGKHARPGQPRKIRPPSAVSPYTDDSSVPAIETRPYSSVALSNLGSLKAKHCVVPSMQNFDRNRSSTTDHPDFPPPALGEVGQCALEEFEMFDSTSWDSLSTIDREIRFLQLQLLSVAKKNCVFRNAVADALQAEIDAKSTSQRFTLADQKIIETALGISSRRRQLQITMESGLQSRTPGILLPGDPESGSDDAVCCVCFFGESLDDNQIVFCEGCNMAVHQSCYGIKNIPDGDWFCDSCVLSCKPVCVICRKKDGAFKVCVGARHSSGDLKADSSSQCLASRESKLWVHVLCALWHPEVSFESLAVMREADLSHAEFFSKKTCIFCHQNGYLMSCSGRCRQQYHPMCAWLGGWFIENTPTQRTHPVPPLRKRELESVPQTLIQVALNECSKYVPPMKVAAKCIGCLDPSKRKMHNQDHNSKMRLLLSQVPVANGNKSSKRGSAAILEDDSGRRMLHLVRRTFLPPDEFPPGVCMICHFDVHNENRRKLRRSSLMTCSRGCGASVHKGCANMLPDDSCMEDDTAWTCMLCMEQESLGAVECMLCPRRGGLFQRCSEYPGWVHSICARLMCNIRPGFKGYSISEPVNTGTIIQDYRDAKSKRVCCVCRQQGKVLHGCAHPGCEKYMHPICALIKQCKSTFDASKNSKNSCTLFCAQHSPVVDLDEADARVLQEEAKHYADLLEIRVHLDKLRDLVNFAKRRERWKLHLDSVELSILSQYEQRMQEGDASLFSAAILAPPVPSNGFELDTIASDCDHGDADDFVPKKRERNPAIWFDVPNRGGIGMIHVAKRKCPEIMFRYLNQLSQRDGREGWLFPTLEKDSCISPSKLRLHKLRSATHAFPPSPAPQYGAGTSPRDLRGKPSRLDVDGLPSPHSDSSADANSRFTRSSRQGIGFGAFNSSASSTSHARVSSSPDSCVGQLTPNIYLKGTKIHVINGKHEGLSAEIVSYSAVGWYTASFKGSKETWKIRSCDFRVIQNK